MIKIETMKKNNYSISLGFYKENGEFKLMIEHMGLTLEETKDIESYIHSKMRERIEYAKG